jgi:hypothetical protein
MFKADWGSNGMPIHTKGHKTERISRTPYLCSFI